MTGVKVNRQLHMTSRPLAALRRHHQHDSSDDEAAPIVVFDETQYGIRRRDGAAVSGAKALRAGTKIDLDTSNVVPVSRRMEMDAEDVADMEVSALWERLNQSVEDIAASTLKGRDKRSYLLEKTARLSGHELETPRTPFKILKGMRGKAKMRERREKEESRVTGSIIVKKAQTLAVATKKSSKPARSRK